MKKMFMVAMAFMITLILVLPVPAMASKPSTSVLHYDINFVTELTNPSNQILVAQNDQTNIFILGGEEAFGLLYYGDYGWSIGLQSGKCYEVWAQVRGKPNTSALWNLGKDTLTSYKGKDDWVPIAIMNGDSELWTSLYNNGCTNFATRWYEIPCLTGGNGSMVNKSSMNRFDLDPTGGYSFYDIFWNSPYTDISGNIVDLGSKTFTEFNAITRDNLVALTYSSASITAVVGDVFAVHTSNDNYAKVQVIDVYRNTDYSIYSVSFRWVTY